MVATVATAGLRDVNAHIDGVAIRLPGTFLQAVTIRQMISATLSGRGRVDSWYDGAGLPDQPDHYDFGLQWQLSQDYSAEITQLEQLAAAGGSHTFIYWKKRTVQYTAKSGDTVFYLPRPDAFSRGYAGHTAQSTDGAVVTVNGAAMSLANTVYQTSVTSATAVTAGQVWISNTAVIHPDSGYTVALFKFGTARTAGDIIQVEFIPQFAIAVGSISTSPFTGDNVGREDKSLTFAELNG